MILYLLQREPSYGYEISKQIRQLSDEKYEEWVLTKEVVEKFIQ
ncbi:MAG: PadR family transcriptional regulator [Lachnospiraceae bacterium]|nr:PadR family transcriptional regulator [Lachnospiraceae bacterium]